MAQQTATPAKSSVSAKSQAIDQQQLMADLRALASADMKGRRPGTTEHDKARDYVARRFAEAGLQPLLSKDWLQNLEIKSRRLTEPVRGANVVGVVRGTNGPERYLVIGAHYDHIGVIDGKLYPGANDNASGAAALIALASYFAKSKPKHTLVFVAFDGEEFGGQGSRAFVDSQVIPLDAIDVMLNADMVGRDAKQQLFVVGTYHWPNLLAPLEDVAKRAPVKVLFGHDKPMANALPGSSDEDWTHDSDHYSFHLKKVPWLYFGVEDFANHHRPTDTVETMQPEFYAGSVETIRLAIERLDGMNGR